MARSPTSGRPTAARGRGASDTALGSTLYAYLLNNYWHTNYKADQSGLLGFRFVLRPHGAFDATELRRFSADTEQPLLAMAVEAETPHVEAPFRVEGDGVVVNALRPARYGSSLLVRLYNPSGAAASARIEGTRRYVNLDRATPEGLAGEPIPRGTLVLAPYEWVLVRLDFYQ